jgi:hypothetical protein
MLSSMTIMIHDRRAVQVLRRDHAGLGTRRVRWLDGLLYPAIAKPHAAKVRDKAHGGKVIHGEQPLHIALHPGDAQTSTPWATASYDLVGTAHHLAARILATGLLAGDDS